MNIKHKSFNLNGKNKIYIYVELNDEYEFGEEFLSNEKVDNFFNKLKAYANKKIEFKKDDVAVLVINGVLIGTMSLGIFLPEYEDKLIDKNYARNIPNYTVVVNDEKEPIKEKEIEKEFEKEPETIEELAVIEETNVASEPAITVETSPVNTQPATVVATPPIVKDTPVVVTGHTVKLNTNGSVITLNLEDYVIGVVAAEMPALFNIEALKAQSIASRTFAMQKVSQGVTLQNSTSHQLYKNEASLKQMWGNNYTTYYNKIKSAVNSTQGMVMKHNGKYIDALYHSMSNSKTELPKYVWGSNLPYLQSVNSTWDTRVKGFETSINVTYGTLSSKLGVSVNKDTNIEVLSETVSGRVESIKIGDKTFSGVKIRSLLGLRSTDFKIVKNDSNVTITTRGHGHGVGMSQNGANEAAKDGYTYDRILKHYYTGINIVNI